MVSHKKIIRDEIIRSIPRLLTQLNRDPNSPTYGCFDRNHWHYKIRDFSSMVLQQNVLALALLYKNNFDGNYLFKSPVCKEYILAALNYWEIAQHKSGGFDEYWPNEQGYPPLVFSTHAVLRTIELLKLPKADFHSSLKKAIEKIIDHTEINALNQESAGITALLLYSKLYDCKKSKQAYQNRIKLFLLKQNSEGWFAEYGGADIGYSSVTLHYLSEIYRITKDLAVKKSIKNLSDFLVHFVHPDGGVGGEYGSRLTEYFLLGGASLSSKYSNSSQLLLKSIDWKLDRYDDRYLFHYVFHSYIEGYLFFPKEFAKTKPQPIDNQWFKNSGLIIRKTQKSFFISNLYKGGIFKVYSKRKLIAKDGGYRIFNGALSTSNHLFSKTEVSVRVSTDRITLTSPFAQYKVFHNTPLKHTLLRLVALLPFKKRIIMALKKVLILQNKPSHHQLRRTIKFENVGITIEDQIDNLNGSEKIESTINGSLRFVPSSNFFDPNDSMQAFVSKTVDFSDGKVFRTHISYEK